MGRDDVVAIRQAFYEGIGRCCVRAAWSAVDELRSEQAGFLGRPLTKTGISQRKIADAIDRSAGEICRWLQGKSPNWANLMVVMLVLDADWENLGSLPTKQQRKQGGISQALFVIRRSLLGDDSKTLAPPTTAELRGIKTLFEHLQWPLARRIAARRAVLLASISQEHQLNCTFLDHTDGTWGDAFSILQDSYLDSIDVAIWR